eukprot:361627-Pyramimonas_sp.AAC.1
MRLRVDPFPPGYARLHGHAAPDDNPRGEPNSTERKRGELPRQGLTSPSRVHALRDDGHAASVKTANSGKGGGMIPIRSSGELAQ